MRMTTGRGKYGAAEDVVDTTFTDLVEALRDMGHMPRDTLDKDHSYWIAPFIRHADATQRRVEDVEIMSNWFGCDLDRDNYDIDQLRAKLVGLSWLAYTTASSTIDAMRWRILYLLDREYDPRDHARLFRWTNSMLDGKLDANTKNCNRIFYLPSAWNDTPCVFDMSFGRPMNVDTILALVPADTVNVSPVHQVHLSNAPSGTTVITKHMLERAMSSPRGGRLMHLMASAATRFRKNGWDLTANELAAAAMDASAQFAPTVARSGVEREAQRAIDWARRNHQPMTKLERLKQRIIWERSRK